MSAVDTATAALANTSIQDPAVDNKDAANEAATASAAEGRRLYIGNLAYATTEGELKDFFKDYLVESTSIPVNPRTNRPVGYAFVDLSTPNEAERAIGALNSQTILDRKVSIQLARKPESAGEAKEGEAAAGGETRRGSGRGRGRGRGGRGGRAARGGRTDTNGAAGEADPADDTPTNVPGQVAPLTETTNQALTAEKGAEGTTTLDAKAKTPRTPAQPKKQRGPPEDGIPSKTKVMVANLPYDLREEKLLELFKDYSPTSAKIALRPIPRFMVKKLQARNEPRKGRGFGFVTMQTEELQQKACTEMNGKEIEGREIAVKVAIDSPGKEDEEIIPGEDGPSTAEGSGSVEPPTATVDA